MLALNRKKGEFVKIVMPDGREIDCVVIEVRGDNVRLGFDAPKDCQINRLEVHEAIQRAGGGGRRDDRESCCNGLSLLDFFAAHAPPMDDAWASYRRAHSDTEREGDEEVLLTVQWRWHYANAMLAEREKCP